MMENNDNERANDVTNRIIIQINEDKKWKDIIDKTALLSSFDWLIFSKTEEAIKS